MPIPSDWEQQYEAYMASAAWDVVRARVLERENHVCQGCRIAPATVVHHLTYDNMGREFLWELAAVCETCHARIHPQHHT